MRNRKGIFISLAVCAVWLSVWQAAHMLVYAGMGTSLLLPSPAETFLRLRQLLGDPSFYSIIGYTFLRIFSGFLLGTAAGCILGGLTAFSPLLYRFFALPMNAIKSTPVASFVILALVWIKGENLSTFIAFLMVLPVIWQSVHTGLGSAGLQLEIGHRRGSDRHSLPGHRYPALQRQDLSGYARAVCLDHCDYPAVGSH